MKSKRNIIVACTIVGAVAIAVAITKWGETILFLLLLGVGSIFLFFQQDFHPWEESMGDLAFISLDTKAAVDTQELSAMAPATRNNRAACADFVMNLDRQTVFSVNAQTYFKIRIRTECPCQGNGHDRGGNLTKVHITRGPNKGLDGWVCRSAVGLTVAFP